MVTVCKIRDTGQIVYPISQEGRYTWCLFPFSFESKKGHRGVIQPVINDKLTEKKYGYG